MKITFNLHSKTKENKKEWKNDTNSLVQESKFPLIITFLRSTHDANILHFVSTEMTMIP